MMSIMFRGTVKRTGGLAYAETQKPASGTDRAARLSRPKDDFTDAMVGSTSPAAQEQVRNAAYDAVERVLTSLLQPLGAKTLTTRWNDALDAMAKHLATRCTSRQ